MTVQGSELVTRVREWVIANRQKGASTAELRDDTDLIASGILDSVGFVQMLAYVEDLTGKQVDLSNIEPESFTTLAGFCTHASGQLQSPSPTT